MILRKILAPVIALMAGLIGLSACTTVSLTPLQMEGIRSQQQSAIIMSYHQFQGLYGADVAFVNVQTGQQYKVSMHGGDNWVNAGPDVTAVPPGRYRLLEGTVGDGSIYGKLPLLYFWFDAFDVGPGEVVDIGALTIRSVDVRAMPGAGGQLANLLFTLRPTTQDNYFTYSLDHTDEARVQHMLASKYADLGATPVRRAPRLLVDPSRFEQMVVEAYRPGPDGQTPSTDEARARISGALRQVLSEPPARPLAP